MGLVAHAHEVGRHRLDVHAVLLEQDVEDLLQEHKARLQDLDEAHVHEQLPVTRVMQDAV